MLSETCTIWVCQNCMLHRCNGECGDCHNEDGHDREPWALEVEAIMGMMWDQHNADCYNFPEGTAANWPCDCETNTYSTAACEGCGSTLHGERHAFTLWLD